MFCSNCGAKISDRAKFCPKCGDPIGKDIEEKKEEPKKIDDKAVLAKKKQQTNGCLVAIGIILLALVIPFIIVSSGDQQGAIYGLIGIALLVFIVVGLIALVKKLIKVGIKKPKIALITIAILVIILLLSYLCYRSYSYKNIAEKTSFIQDKVTEIGAAKLLGDTIMKQGATPVAVVTLQNVIDAVSAEKTRLNDVTYPAELKGYIDSVNAWADKIISAKDFTSWNALSDEPEKFEILTSDAWVRGLFGATLEDLANIKDLGTDALKNQDREKLRFIAARLATLEHFYTSIETYQSYAQGTIITPAYAATRSGAAVIKTRTICFPVSGGKIICIPQTRESVGKARAIAQKNYTVGSIAPEQTTADWNGAFQPIGEGLDTLPIGGVGITNGEPNVAPKYPPRVEAFRNSCTARGGDPDPSSLTKERLPTTEGGYNCKIGSCWEFMTYSGRTYAGGGTGCPEEGLVPKAPAPIIPIPSPNPNPNPSPSPTPKPISFDGNYSVRYSYGNCGTNVPGVNLGNLGVFDDSLKVKNNVVSWGGGESAKIDSNGRATWSMNLSGMGYLQQVFNFTNTGVSGTFTFKVSTQGVGVGCNGSFSGKKL